MLNTIMTIAKEAGGLITDHDGKPWSTESVAVVASNGIVHDEILFMNFY